MSRRTRVAVWGLAVSLAAVFVLAGASKLRGASAAAWSKRFEVWGYPAGAHSAVGALEILAGVGLLVPRSRRAAAAVLVAIMIGAAITHLVHGEFPRVIPPLVLGGAAATIFAMSRTARV